MSEKTWLEEFHDGCHPLFEMPYRLTELAEAFDRVGHTETARELRDMATTLRKADNQVRGAIGRMLHEQIQGGEKQMTEILSAVIKSPAKGGVNQ